MKLLEWSTNSYETGGSTLQNGQRFLRTSEGLALPRVDRGWERQAFWFQGLTGQMTNAVKPEEPL